MPCPDSGQIKISDLVAEFGGSAPHSMKEYYRGAAVPANNTNVPESGEVSLTNFYSAVNEIQHTHSSDATNQNYATVFGSNWASAVPKRVIVNSGVTVGATSGNAAMLLPSGMGGTLTIENNGNIEGHGGAANGGNGGNAINCVQTTGVTILNNSGASILAGGGGGGQGGTGGTGGNGGAGGTGGNGSYDYVHATVSCSEEWGSNDGAPHGTNPYHKCRSKGGDGRYQNIGYCGPAYYGSNYSMECLRSAGSTGGSGGAGGTTGGSGGAGGAGGVGQGYNQSNASGSSGSAGSSGSSGSAGSSGGTNAGTGGTGGSAGQGGTGGTGGSGGTFGNSGGTGLTGSQGNTGATGSTGANGNSTNGSAGSGGSAGTSGSAGSAGGSAGFYITNLNSITFTNSGTVAGN